MASTGIPALDEALGGLFWGDNVVWESRQDVSVEPFFRSVASLAREYEEAYYVSLVRPPEEVSARYPGLEVIDARPVSPLASPAPLLQAVVQRCRQDRRTLLLFDSLDLMAERWGTDMARRFFARTCPVLLQLGAIAYWSLTGDRRQILSHEVEATTQCVIAVEDGRLRIVKAEGRRPGTEGTVFRYRLEEGRPLLEPAPAAARLGAALRALRLHRGLSKTDLARMAGVSASAISQAERGARGLSLDTLLRLSSQLHVTLDELLGGKLSPSYRLGRRPDPVERASGKPVALLDDPEIGLRAYLLHLPPRGSAPLGQHKGLELVAVASGLVQVVLGEERPVLRRGEVLLAGRSGIAACRNLSDGEALVFWILRDEVGPETATP